MRQYLRRAARKLTLYIHQNDLRLTNPELFTPLQPVARSPLKWTGKKAELYELLIALDNLDTDCHNERRRILSRNTRRTVFTRRLKKEA